MTRHGRAKTALACASVMALAAASPEVAKAQAAGPGHDVPNSTPAAREGVTVEEVLITARKREERLVDVPVSANALNGQVLERQGVTSFDQLSLLVPQVSIDKSAAGNGAIVTIRGIGSSSVDASVEQEVTIDMDGVPSSRGWIISQAMFDEASVDILKGPQALYFGKNSPAGVIAISSANPGAQDYIRAGVEATTEEWYGEAAYNIPINDAWSARLALRGEYMVNGWITDNAGPITNPAQLPAVLAATGQTLPGSPFRNFPAEREEDARLTVVYKPTGSPFDANFKFLITNHQDHGPSGEAINLHCATGRPGSVDLVTGTYLIDPYSTCGLSTTNSLGTIPASVAAHYPGSHGGIPYGELVTMTSSLTLNYRITDDILLTSVSGFMKYRNSGFDNFDFTDFAIASGENDEFNTTWTEELRLSTSFKGPVNFTGGFFYEHDARHYVQNGAIGYFGAAPNGNENAFGSRQYFYADTYSGYGELNWKITPKLELAGGARYTVERKSGDEETTFQWPPGITYPVGVPLVGAFTEYNTSPQVTLSYHLSPSVLVYGAYKTGFKSGGFSSPALISPAATVSSMEFGQEKVHGGEVGLKFVSIGEGPLGSLSGDLTAYNYLYTGLQLTAFEPPAAYYTQNAGSAISRGVELNLTDQVTRHFSLHSSVGYNHARFVTFANSQCWTGQFASEGCANGVQSLSGAPLSRAPDWTAVIGAAYDTALQGPWNIGLTVDGRHSSGYFTETNNNPFGYQGPFQTLDASVRIYDDKWEFSLIGRNLTNTLYAVLSGDKPLGIRGDVEAFIGRPREIMIQATRRF